MLERGERERERERERGHGREGGNGGCRKGRRDEEAGGDTPPLNSLVAGNPSGGFLATR